jgi:hypothetical protein
MKTALALFLYASAGIAQCPAGSTCITIPAQQITVTIPAQLVVLPVSSGLPTGLTYGPIPTVTTVGPTLTDSQGNKWSINAAAQVQIGTQALTGTSNVIEISVVTGNLWQLNKAGTWYEATAVTGTAPNQTVTWGTGTTTNPVPAGNFFQVAGGVVGSGPLFGSTLNLTGGPPIPVCAGNLYLWKYNPATFTLEPYCYVAP